MIIDTESVKINVNFNNVKRAIDDIQRGKMVIITDDKNREHEGDLVVAAEKITNNQLAFIAKEASGLICVAITQEIANKLNFPVMVKANEESMRTAFTVSVDAKHGITTGISAGDRVRTLHLIACESSTASHFVRPGHMFPLVANPQGLALRRGHTEASVEMMKMANLKNAAVICEIMNEDGTMMRDGGLADFAAANNFTMISINDLVEYRALMKE